MTKKLEKEEGLKALVFNSQNVFPFLLMYAYLHGKGQDNS